MTGADTSRAWRELGAAALAHNVSVLRGALPQGCELMAVVKADAYGHGMAAVVPQLLSLGVRSFAAATLDEGSQLRALGFRPRQALRSREAEGVGNAIEVFAHLQL